jgi:hypothetical protein
MSGNDQIRLGMKWDPRKEVTGNPVIFDLTGFVVLPADELQTPDAFLRLMVATALKECGQ